MLRGETNPQLILNENPESAYHCEITNPDFPDLTLSSQETEEICVPCFNDSLALVALYNATDGPNWDDNANWLTGPIETWFGVGIANGRVNEIILWNNNLTGPIPVGLGNLNSLTNLSLSTNNLTGSIPAEIGNLSLLRHLYLYDNELSGELPSELGNLNALKDLYLSNNPFIGTIPAELGNLTSLDKPLIRNTNITGFIPAELGNLSSLKSLYLDNNELSGPIPAELGNLSSLAELYLYDNELSGEIPSELGNLNSLTAMYIGVNPLSGTIPAELGNLTMLNSLLIMYTNISGSIPVELGNLLSLKALYLYQNELSGSIPAEIGNLISLEKIILSGNNLSGEIPKEIGDLTSLTYLDFHGNSFSGSIPKELGNLASLTGLSLYANALSGPIPKQLGNLTSFTHLKLDQNDLTGPVPTEVGNLTSLEWLLLRNNNLTALTDFSRMNLEVLYVSNNQLDIGDLENANVNWSNFSNHQYSPQAKIPIARLDGSNNITVTVNPSGANSHYQWYLDGEVLAEENTPQIELNYNQAGIYHCVIANTDFPDLILESERTEVILQLKPFDRQLVQGWNWLSVNLLNDDMSLANLFTCATELDYIKSQTESATYYDGVGWFTPLANGAGLDPMNFYKIKVSNACGVEYSGLPVSVTDNPISIETGWNWIGYLPQEAINIQPDNIALSSLSLQELDYIKNQAESATWYDGYGWFGSLDLLEPQDGYMLKKQSADVLIYPESAPLEQTARKRANVQTGIPYSVNQHEFAFSGSVTTNVFVDGVLAGSENDMVLAYVDDQLRGVSNGIYFEPADAFAFPLMVYSNLAEGEVMTFKYYNATSDRLYTADETLAFSQDMIVADAYKSFELNVNSAVGMEDMTGTNGLSLEVYPNPFNDQLSIEYSITGRTHVRIEVYDMLGNLMELMEERTINPGSYKLGWNAEAYPEAAYLLKVTTEKDTRIMKVILTK